MKLECSVGEFKNLFEVFDLKEEKTITKNVLHNIQDTLPVHTYENQPPIMEEMPPHKFPLLNRKEYQRIYKEVPQEVPKED